MLDSRKHDRVLLMHARKPESHLLGPSSWIMAEHLSADERAEMKQEAETEGYLVLKVHAWCMFRFFST